MACEPQPELMACWSLLDTPNPSPPMLTESKQTAVFTAVFTAAVFTAVFTAGPGVP